MSADRGSLPITRHRPGPQRGRRALLVAAGLRPAAEHALISLLALNGLRVSEAIGANIEALGVERGHPTLTVIRKGGKTVTVLLAPRTTMRYDRARASLDRHATYIVSTYVAGAAR